MDVDPVSIQNLSLKYIHIHIRSEFTLTTTPYTHYVITFKIERESVSSTSETDRSIP